MAGGTLGVVAAWRACAAEGPAEVARRLASSSLTLLCGLSAREGHALDDVSWFFTSITPRSVLPEDASLYHADAAVLHDVMTGRLTTAYIPGALAADRTTSGDGLNDLAWFRFLGIPKMRRGVGGKVDGEKSR
jgi:hypothetical protein